LQENAIMAPHVFVRFTMTEPFETLDFEDIANQGSTLEEAGGQVSDDLPE
jgi:hypothetical protein